MGLRVPTKDVGGTSWDTLGRSGHLDLSSMEAQTGAKGIPKQIKTGRSYRCEIKSCKMHTARRAVN